MRRADHVRQAQHEHREQVAQHVGVDAGRQPAAGAEVGGQVAHGAEDGLQVLSAGLPQHRAVEIVGHGRDGRAGRQEAGLDEHDGALDGRHVTEPLHLARPHPQHGARRQPVADEVDGVGGRAGVDGDDLVEVQPLRPGQQPLRRPLAQLGEAQNLDTCGGVPGGAW
ncbi:hypothetical protein GCM10020000_42310 [Streptomyces olivoverticillatus]